jgi:uncharacterized membrane protein YgcG
MTRGFALWAGLATLAAIIVAGVTIAVFPHEKRTAVPGPILVPRVAPAPPVVISFPAAAVGRTATATATATPTRGGAARQTATSRDVGVISIRASRRPPTMQARAVPARPVKKTTTRPTSIGGSSGSNGDVGLASGSSAGMGGGGEQSSGPCGSCP